jgi:hypothetical protein
MFPKELVNVVDFLNTIDFEVSNNHEDGRVNSIDDEDNIIKALKKEFGDDISKPAMRCWKDLIAFNHPTQLKSSNFTKKASDNFNSKSAILYALTDLPEDKVKVNSWRKFEECLLNHCNGENNRDYYIIVLDKNNKKFYLNSLKSLNKLTPNGNNLPFQIKWTDNLIPVERTYEESYQFIIKTYKKSVQAKINAHPYFNQL